MTGSEKSMKSGFIAVLGLPNAGKSTLTNALVGEKVSIVSWRPQTTRDKIVGIVNDEDSQIVLIDTPGIHEGKSKLAAFMAEEISSARSGSDGALYVLDGSRILEKQTFEFIKSLAATTPTVVVVNKMDVADKALAMQIVARLSEIKGVEVVPVSAAKKENLDELLKVVKGMLKDDVPYYPEDMYTDKPLRFMAAEIVREKALKFLLAEIPHGIGVEIRKFETGEDGVTRIEADVICEKETHKPIIIGKGGATLKRISVAARKELESLVDGQVYLRLFVKVKNGWQDDGNVLNLLGYVKKK